MEVNKIKMWGNKKVGEKDYLIALIIVAGLVGLFFVYTNFVPKGLFVGDGKISVEIIEIGGNCEECFDLSVLTTGLENVNIKSNNELDYSSEEGKKVMEKYGVTKVPALIVVSKKINDVGLDENFFVLNDNYAIFDKPVPYVDLVSGEVKGIVNMKEIQDLSCTDCASLSNVRKSLEGAGIVIEGYEIIDYKSDAGKVLVEENSLEFVPNLLMSKNIREYWWIFNQLEGSLVEKGDYYSLDVPMAPYKDVFTGKVKGIVDITFITNESCVDCFDVTQLKSGFQNMGIYIDKEKTYDVSDSAGKNFLIKYKLKALPTIVLSGGVKDYDAIKPTLDQLGTFETDGNFVLRELESLGVKYQKVE